MGSNSSVEVAETKEEGLTLIRVLISVNEDAVVLSVSSSTGALEFGDKKGPMCDTA